MGRAEDEEALEQWYREEADQAEKCELIREKLALLREEATFLGYDLKSVLEDLEDEEFQANQDAAMMDHILGL